MKKSILMTALLAVVCVCSVAAQPRAVGGNIGYGIGLSYQHSLGEANMIDAAVNIPFFNGIGGIVTYDWINPFNTAVPWEYNGEWNWYLGAGIAAGIYGFKEPFWYAGVAGQVGIEYNFWFPLQLSLDWRPNLGPCGSGKNIGFNINGLYDGITIGVRYKF